MRVLMTGGYGCIGSWVAKQLADAGQEVWIYDLKEDTHRLDLILEPGTEVAGPFRRRRRVRPGLVPIGRRAAGGRPTSCTWRACKRPTCRANPLLGAKVNVLGTLAVFETARRAQGSGRAGRLCQLGGGARPPGEGSTGSVADLVRLAPLTHYGAFKVCNELNAQVYWLDHGITSVGLRPWTVYGVGRDFGMTSEPTKAIKAVALGRPYRISYGGKQDLQYVGDVAAHVRACASRSHLRGPTRSTCAGRSSRSRLSWMRLCEVAPEARSLVTHGDRQLPIAADLDDSRLESRLGPIPRTPLREGIADTFHRFVELRDQGRLDDSDL